MIILFSNCVKYWDSAGNTCVCTHTWRHSSSEHFMHIYISIQWCSSVLTGRPLTFDEYINQYHCCSKPIQIHVSATPSPMKSYLPLKEPSSRSPGAENHQKSLGNSKIPTKTMNIHRSPQPLALVTLTVYSALGNAGIKRWCKPAIYTTTAHWIKQTINILRIYNVCASKACKKCLKH